MKKTPKASKKRKPNPRRKKVLTLEEREDARDVAIIRREIAKGGRTYSHAQVMKELGYHDLATPLRSSR